MTYSSRPAARAVLPPPASDILSRKLRHRSALHLSFMPGVGAYGFRFGSTTVRLDGQPVHFRTRAAAVLAATDCGIVVDAVGNCTVAP